MDHNNTKPESSADSKENRKPAKNCDGSSKTKPSVPAKRQGLIMSVLIRITHIWPLKYVFKILRKIASFAGLSREVENVGSHDLFPERRRFLSGKKRIGRLARLILFITPYRLQCALGYHPAESLGKAAGAEDIRKSPLKPSGKGNKRKQDDVEMEEEYHSWVSFMAEELPEEDQEDDPTYEPSDSGTDDTEENKSNNETESDIEVEEQDGVVMLKESPKGKETPASKNMEEAKNESSNESSKNTEQITSSAE